MHAGTRPGWKGLATSTRGERGERHGTGKVLKAGPSVFRYVRTGDEASRFCIGKPHEF